MEMSRCQRTLWIAKIHATTARPQRRKLHVAVCLALSVSAGLAGAKVFEVTSAADAGTGSRLLPSVQELSTLRYCSDGDPALFLPGVSDPALVLDGHRRR